MTTLTLALLWYSITSYLFSGSICCIADTAKNQQNQANLGIIFFWPWWIIKGISQEEKGYFQKLLLLKSKPIGNLLQKAGLMTETEVEKILEDQRINHHRKFGEIAVMMEIIKQETVDFFVEIFHKQSRYNHRKPIGEYLKSAGLLSQEEIKSILEEQPQTSLRFGELVVQKGWLKQQTIDFVLHYIQFPPAAET